MPFAGLFAAPFVPQGKQGKEVPPGWRMTASALVAGASAARYDAAKNEAFAAPLATWSAVTVPWEACSARFIRI